jgi:GH25 family lysozyme M1 (1,4-beta-N-acetylmuramidase)
MKHAGMGWPNGPVAGGNGHILALPSSDLLMLATEGRYHYDEAVRAGKRVLWRSIPRIGKRPAELGWSPARFVAETINLTDAPTLPITDFIWANELDLNYERGDSADDWSGLAQRYALIGGWALSVVQSLKQWSPETRIHWPAFTPDHQALDFLDSWMAAADACAVVDFHAYDNLGNIAAQYLGYRSAFPDTPLCLTEWHCRGDLEEERRVLEWLAETMRDDPLFDAAYFFIWKWHNAAGWWSDDWDIEHNPDRLALFMNPPIVEPVEPEEPVMALPRGVDVASYQGYPDWGQVKAAGYDFAITKITEDTGYVNPTAGYNWREIKAAGLIRGAYHFCRPGYQDATAEADFLLDVLDSLGGLETGDLIAPDMESGSGDLGAWTLEFLRRCEARCGFKPLVYTGAWFTSEHNFAAYPELAEYPLWLAAYQAAIPFPPAPWQFVSIWQHSSSGQVPGIDGDVDLNVFNGELNRLPLLGKPAPSEPEEPEYAVGSGLLTAMQTRGDSPASDEVYVKQGDKNEWSEAVGQSGAVYRWIPSTGRVAVYEPS